MKELMLTGACMVALVPGLCAQPVPPEVWEYQLLDGSYFQDECLICGRPTIQQPLRGKFQLFFSGGGKSNSFYTVTNILFQTRSGTEVTITGSGRVELLGAPIPVAQNAVFDLKVNDQQKLFTNDVLQLDRTLPMVDIHLVQTQVDLVQFFSIQIAAAPLRDLWFTTTQPFFSTNLNARVLTGDLLSQEGRLLRRRSQVVSQFGFAPSPEGYPIQSVGLAPGAEVQFSLTQDVFSETRNKTYHTGDLLSDKGYVLLTNQELINNFAPQVPGPNVGLDALQVAGGGELLFSVASNFVSERIGQISAGDLLSYRPTPGGGTNRLVATSQQLISAFTPVTQGDDPGLDAVYVWPNGDIWFSTERDFNSQTLGPLSNGDLLCNGGYVVFRSAELLSNFAPSDEATNAGLNGLYIVTDAVVSLGGPQFTGINKSNAAVVLQYSGTGRAFQVERSPDVQGPYSPAAGITPDLFFTDPGAETNAPSFFRLRQW